VLQFGISRGVGVKWCASSFCGGLFASLSVSAISCGSCGRGGMLIIMTMMIINNNTCLSYFFALSKGQTADQRWL
jgi:hypothetical protein